MSFKTWQFDGAHSSIGFSVRHMLVSKVHGRFARWSGALRFEEAAPAAAQVEVAIDVASIDTGVPARDAHLRSTDFLDANAYPLITFRSVSVEATGPRQFRLRGDLTIRDVTREVVLEVEYGGRMRDPRGHQRVGFSATTSIDRKAFGVTFNQILDTGGLALGDRVEIRIDAEATDAQPVAVSSAAVSRNRDARTA
jgi:polyisoprenoid-binding protein YceI